MVNDILKTIKDSTNQINELHRRFKIIENLITDITPGFERVCKETNPIVRELREKFERDETLTFVMRIGDSIPSFVRLLEVMNAVKGLLEDLSSVPDKISKETLPIVRELRERFERDETLKLIKQVGDNIPTMVRFLEIMPAVKGLIDDLSPAIDKILHETAPTIKILRESFEKDETIEILKKTGENINTFNKLLDTLSTLDKSGDLEIILENAVAKETRCLIKVMENCVVKTMQEVKEKPIKPGLGKIIFAIREPEVQKGLLFLMTLARNIPQCILETMKDSPQGER
ncbi:MAG: DUF1641 domain-containing protein [bacterium]